MYDSTDLIKSIKKIALDAVNTSKPANIVFGKVIAASPIKIQIDQKMILASNQLVLTRNVTDYIVEMTINHATENASHTHKHELEGGTETLDYTYSHNHEYKGKKEFLVHNALNVDEEVILAQIQGGQKYIVLDRI